MLVYDYGEDNINNRAKKFYFTVENQLINQTGSLYLKTFPLQVNIFLNNVYYGLTPRFIQGLLPGQKTLKLSKNGYLDYYTNLTINRGQLTTIFAELRPSLFNQSNNQTKFNQTNQTLRVS